MTRRDDNSLGEMLQAIEVFTAKMDRATFAADQKTVYAVVRALEIVSEASRRLPVELKDRHPEIDWVAVAAAGNVYRHEYEGVEENRIWHTVRHDLSALRGEAEVPPCRRRHRQAVI